MPHSSINDVVQYRLLCKFWLFVSIIVPVNVFGSQTILVGPIEDIQSSTKKTEIVPCLGEKLRGKGPADDHPWDSSLVRGSLHPEFALHCRCDQVVLGNSTKLPWEDLCSRRMPLVSQNTLPLGLEKKSGHLKKKFNDKVCRSRCEWSMYFPLLNSVKEVDTTIACAFPKPALFESEHWLVAPVSQVFIR